MSQQVNPVIVIPARLGSTRLPNKPLADIAGAPMIVQVWRRAREADIGPVVVACAEPEIAEAVEAEGGRAILTDADLPSGSDRVFAALEILDPAGNHGVVVNLQGDLPTIAPGDIRAALAALADGADIGTLACPIGDPAERDDPNVVKVAIALQPGANRGRALSFSRAAAEASGREGDGKLYHHIGIYAYRREALARFVALPTGVMEARERLEQLRAMEAGMRIDVGVVDSVPLGVDTPADLERAREIFAGQGTSP